MLQRTERLGIAPGPDHRTIRIRCVRDFAELAAAKAQWDALLARADDPTVFQTFEWQASWWSVFGEDFRPFVLWAEDDGGLIGLAPLMLAERRCLGCRRRVAHFIGLHAADYCDFIIDRDRPEVLAMMLAWLSAHADHWDVLDLRNIQGNARSLEVVVDHFARHGTPVETRHWGEAPTHLFGDGQADRDLLRKKSLRRHWNYWQRQGRLTCSTLTTAAEIGGHLDGFFRQHVERWGQTPTPSVFLDPRQRRFHHELVRRLAPTGHLRFAVVALDDRPLAYHLGFEFAGRFLWYKPTFDSTHARHSPGEVLLKYLLEEAHGRTLLEFDFGPGEEAFKYRFSNQVRPIRSVHVHRDWLSFGHDRLKFRLRTALKRAAVLQRLRSPTLHRWYRRIWY
jgi:CelD/BcsL family acetyltransferase involved in cellulose biosynthesis